MRAQLLHLSGPRRGRTDSPPGPEVLVGSEATAQIRFPAGAGVAARHAVLKFDDCGCEFLIEAIDGAVFVNHREVREVILREGDLLEFGFGGPKARFRVWHGDGASCKPVRAMIGDAAAVGRESGLVASGSSLVRDLLTQATLGLKIGFPILVAGLVGLAFAAGWFGGGKTTAGRLGEELGALRAELEQLRADQVETVTREEVEAVRTELATRAAAIDELARVREVVRQVLERDTQAVCLVHGVWGLRLPEAMRRPGVEWVTDPGGQVVELEYTGSGFHVGEGRIVTNRHVALPWENADEIRGMVERGFVPGMFRMSVTFPRHASIAVDLTATRVRPDDQLDVALLRAAVPDDVPALRFDDRPEAELRGETVLVVGYPTGVNALLAKAEAEVAQAVVEAAGGDLGRIIDGLATRGAVSPVITRGVLSEVRSTRLVYDAETTSGGSGGPVIGADGRVLGVNFAITVGFGGSNFGVPIRFAADLLPK
jgi:S1-C subfamily serine protease